jgi:hypothetical protein
MLFPWYEPFLPMRFAASFICIRLPAKIFQEAREVCSMFSCLMLFVRCIVLPATMVELRFALAPIRWLLNFVS